MMGVDGGHDLDPEQPCPAGSCCWPLVQGLWEDTPRPNSTQQGGGGAGRKRQILQGPVATPSLGLGALPRATWLTEQHHHSSPSLPEVKA